VDRLAAELAAHGVRPGDRVVLWLPSHWRTPVYLFALWKLGAVVVPFDREMNPEAGARIFAAIDPRCTLMTLAGIVVGQIGCALACRSPRQSIWQLGLGTNRALLVAIVYEITLLAALMYVPPLAAVFELAPLGPWHWLLLATFGPLLLLLEQGRKALRRRTESPDLPGPSRS
jgi:cation transport ATPase-like protein/AMP-binding enzyme